MTKYSFSVIVKKMTLLLGKIPLGLEIKKG